MKSCAKCKAEKEESEFYRHWDKRDQKYRIDSWCKLCTNQKNRDYEQSIEGQEKRRRSLFKRKYDITPEYWDELFRLQAGKCGICGKHFSSDSRSIHVDHDHETGKVRGLLCHLCNTKLDWYLENREAIELWGWDQTDPTVV